MRKGRVGSTVAVYVDVANVNWNGGYGMQYDVLRQFACRDDSIPVRLNAYVTYDRERADQDARYRENQDGFHFVLRDFGYKVVEKTMRWYEDDAGRRYGKANADLELAVDALLQTENIDRVVLVSGDGDFVEVVRALQNRGCRVEIIGFDNVSSDLRREADLYTSGYLIPNLLPVEGQRGGPLWGEIHSRVRGVCYQKKGGYGFFRYMKQIAAELWKTDSREEGSPYESVFFHDSNLPPQIAPHMLPNRNVVLEFELIEDQVREGKMQAVNVVLVSPRKWITAATAAAGATAAAPGPVAVRARRDDVGETVILPRIDPDELIE